MCIEDKKLKKYLIFVIVLFILAGYIFMYGDVDSEFESLSKYHITIQLNFGKPKVKNILIHYYSAYVSKSSLMRFGVNETWQGENCCYECKYTFDISQINSTDAVILHHFDMRRKLKRSQDKEQIWVYFQQESPSNANKDAYGYYEKNFFNWTMTYRKDSDIHYPYGKFVKGKSSYFNVSSKQNAKPIAWIVSNCAVNSRATFAKDLGKFFEIDKYGHCGTLKCSNNTSPYRYISNMTCQEEIGEKYKFYLALENSQCPEYVTEKFFESLVSKMVPIVDGINFDYNQIAPPKSFIDKSKFNSTEELSKYLQELLENEDKYSEYFNWRDSYRVEIDEEKSRAWCSLCTRLHQLDKEKHKSYEDLSSWWLNNYTSSHVCKPKSPN